MGLRDVWVDVCGAERGWVGVSGAGWVSAAESD